MAEYRVLGNGKLMKIEAAPRRVASMHAVSVIEAVGSAVGPGVGAVTAGAAGMAGSAVAAIMGDARKPHPRLEKAHEEEMVEKIDDATGEVVPGAGAKLRMAKEEDKGVEVEPVLECAAEEGVKVKEAGSSVGGELPIGDGKLEEWGFRIAETSEEKSEGEEAEAESSEGGELPIGDGKLEDGKKRRRRR